MTIFLQTIQAVHDSSTSIVLEVGSSSLNIFITSYENFKNRINATETKEFVSIIIIFVNVNSMFNRIGKSHNLYCAHNGNVYTENSYKEQSA